MSIISLAFIAFLGIVFLIYFLTPPKYQWITLLAFSYVFYLFAGVKLLAFLAFTTASTFYLGLAIQKINTEYSERAKVQGLSRAEKKGLKEEGNKKKKKFMLAALLANFGILFVLKYLSYLSVPSNFLFSRLGIDLALPTDSLFLPLGISFYTFQSMGYIVDLYRNKFQAETNLFRFALFVSFFPQIIQGPISRFDELAGQLYKPHAFDYTRVKFGLELMLWGYFKKLVIADRIAIMTSAVFANPEQYQGFYVVFAGIFSWLELYFDFSGGIDIVRGVAEALGIVMPENFKRPFFADSLAEFWRRWHMTLNNWWRDYIFYPLTLSKAFTKLGKKCKKIFGNEAGKKVPIMLALLIVRVINGVWHGAYLYFFIGGLYNGIMIALAFLLEPQFKRWIEKLHVNTACLSWKAFRIVRTFLLLCVPKLIYNAETWGQMMFNIRCAFGQFNPWIFFDESLFTLGVSKEQFYLVLAALLIVFTVSLFQEMGYNIRQKLEEQNVGFRWLVYLTGICAIMFFGVYGIGYDVAGFQYMQF